MLHASRRRWRLFYLRLGCVFLALVGQGIAQGPTLTTVSDTVYRADGSPASGTVLISWPAFTAASGATVAAGNNHVTLGTNGSFSAQLAPNAGATPAGTVYSVTYQLTDGTVKTENWSIGTSSPETISQVRTLAGITTQLAQAATQQYVNAQLATVVHLSGTETITGSKQFSVPPTLPTPSQSGQAVNKAYVDSAVGNSGGGNFVAKAGDTMTGPLTLPADPTAPQQAADKHYIDLIAATKSDLVGGRVPTVELGTGTANNAVCLHGDSTWSGCGTGSGSGLTPGMLAIKYATDFAWSQGPSNNLSTPGAQMVNLTQCPFGVTGSEAQYYIYISGTGTAEAALVTGGSCAGNGSPGTLQFTTANAHPAGYAVGSASGGLQEALIAARFIPSNPAGTSQSGKVIVPPGELKLFARVSIRASNVTVDFSGSIVECWMNDTCLFLGDAAKSLSFELEAAKVTTPLTITPITNAQVGSTVLPDLTSAQITQVASTTVSIDTGIPALSAGGFEVRWSDGGWGPYNDENLAGRFTTQIFTLPRLSKVQNYFLRRFDGSVPPRYSRQSAALHVDFPY